MLNQTSVNLVRLALPLLALCFAGAALAEPNNGDITQKIAKCFSDAEFQYDLEIGQCAGNPAPWVYANCMDQAHAHYLSAVAACSLMSVSVVSNMGSDSLKARPSRPSGALGQGRTGTGRWPAVGSTRQVFIPNGGGHHRR